MVIDTQVLVDNLSVDYFEYRRGGLNPFGKLTPIRGIEEITFNLERGDVVALLGRNGAGKSTFLKAIAGKLRPSKGQVKTTGRVILLSGSDPGFFHDITGRQNILELGEAYGVGQDRINDFYESVVNFASLGDAIDRNVRGYSTGMRGKLGFGFMTGLSPDVLLIDETLGVGDQEFRMKAQERLASFISNSGSVIISTHSLGLAKKICNKGIILDNGKLLFSGTITETLSKYHDLVG